VRQSGGGKIRNATAGPEIKLYAKNANGVWTCNDTSSGGVGDTTANWEVSSSTSANPNANAG
jgi:hypothetical protein